MPAAGASGGKLPARPVFNAPKASGGAGGAAPAMPRPAALVSGGAAKPMASALPASAAAAPPIAVYVPKPEAEPVLLGKPVPIPAAAMETVPSRQVRACAAGVVAQPTERVGGFCRFQSRRQCLPLCPSARQRRQARPLWRRWQRCRVRVLRRVAAVTCPWTTAALRPAAAEQTRASRLCLTTRATTATSSEPRLTRPRCCAFAAV